MVSGNQDLLDDSSLFVNVCLVLPSIADAFVNSFKEKAFKGPSALLTSHLSRLVSRLEGRLLHRSVTHYESPSPRKLTPLNLTLA
jgi:hypothetical protein